MFQPVERPRDLATLRQQIEALKESLPTVQDQVSDQDLRLARDRIQAGILHIQQTLIPQCIQHIANYGQVLTELSDVLDAFCDALRVLEDKNRPLAFQFVTAARSACVRALESW